MVWIIALLLIIFLFYLCVIILIVGVMILAWFIRLFTGNKASSDTEPVIIDNRQRRRYSPRRLFYRGRQVNQHWRR